MSGKVVYSPIVDALGWLRSSLNCPTFKWDGDQRAYASEALSHAERVLHEPIDMVLFCPACGMQHIDKADEPPMAYAMGMCASAQSSTWANPPHKSHLCVPAQGGCGHVWRPADVPTNGVAAITTKGTEDSPLVQPGMMVRWARVKP